MASRAFRRSLRRLPAVTLLSGLVGLSGCQAWLSERYGESLPPTSGVQPIKGLAQNASVRRDTLGTPLIESSNFHDALFTLGYVNAGDRLSQMVRMRLLAQGRLAELEGNQVLDVDRLMRAAHLSDDADQLYRNASPRLQKFFEVYARGVNAYLFRYRDKLPADLAQAGYRVEYWKPQDSALLFCLLDFSLSTNLREEVTALLLDKQVGADKLAWLLPTYPDEPLPQAEADKLKGLSAGNRTLGLTPLAQAIQRLDSLDPLATPGSLDLAITGAHSRSGRSLLAAQLDGAPRLPSPWSLVQVRSPKFQAAGMMLPGLPLLLSGYNGHVAWAMASANGDNQDLFLEQVRQQGSRLEYLADGRWQLVTARSTTYLAKGQRAERDWLYSTRHGNLLGSPSGSGYALALQRPSLEGDRSLDAWFDLTRAKGLQQASDQSREIRALGLNLMFADASSVGWQVTGRYPNRKDGKGLVPSPGWEGRFDWDGYADSMLHPYDQDPPSGWLGTANQRTLGQGYGMQLSSAWAASERSERLAQLAGSGKHDSRSLMMLMSDQTSLFPNKLKAMFQAPGMARALPQAIDALPAAQRDQAREALRRLQAFDGRISPISADAALYELFLAASLKTIFGDELGAPDSPAWQAFIDNEARSYSALADHLLGRDDSPFWDDTRTPSHEDKPAILALSLATAMADGQQLLGADVRSWQWSKLHSVQWKGFDKSVGPLAIGGDRDTLDPSAWVPGRNMNASSAPALRMVVDFGQAEPLMMQLPGGQSSNPLSPHYSDGVEAWRKGQYLTLPMQYQNLEHAYGSTRLTLVPGK